MVVCIILEREKHAKYRYLWLWFIFLFNGQEKQHEFILFPISLSCSALTFSCVCVSLRSIGSIKLIPQNNHIFKGGQVKCVVFFIGYVVPSKRLTSSKSVFFDSQQFSLFMFVPSLSFNIITSGKVLYIMFTSNQIILIKHRLIKTGFRILKPGLEY